MNLNDIKVGIFLVFRYIRGANIWTTLLITFVMFLTFLNLTVVAGLLEGIVVGSLEGLRTRAIGDVYISPNEGDAYVKRTQEILSVLEGDSRIKAYAPRSSVRVEVIQEEEFHKITDANSERKSIKTNALGVDLERERATTNLPKYLLEGEYFSGTNRREILIGSALLERYSPFGESVLGDVQAGDFVYVQIDNAAAGDGLLFDSESASSRDFGGIRDQSEQIAGVPQKYKVQGIFRTKAGELDITVLLDADEVRLNTNIPGNNVSSIAIRTRLEQDGLPLKNELEARFGRYASVETVHEAIGSFLDDIRTVFKLLGNVVGAIGLTVATITIFIIIFVTAVSRSKFIGILKAIGITPNAIRISYIAYALFFAVTGTSLGLIVLYMALVPFFEANPIPFPFSDGILYVTTEGVATNIIILLVATFIAGLIPSNKIINRPAIDAVRGR